MTYTAKLKVLGPGAYGRTELEYTGRVMLPLDAIGQTFNNDGIGPRITVFCITNPQNNAKVYCGMADHNTNPGEIVMPLWMMDLIGVSQFDYIRITVARPPVGKEATFQPLDSTFSAIQDPAIVLSKTLRTFPVLTQGSIIPIQFANRVYRLRVLQTKPSEGIFINNVDLATEFAPPETEFKHRWLEPDTDSDNYEEIKTHQGKTIRGKNVEYTEERKFLHSTFEERERIRNSSQYQPEYVVFENGKSVKPQENKESVMVEKEKEKYEKKDTAFIGQSRFLGKNKSGSSSMDNMAGSKDSLKSYDKEDKPQQPPKSTISGVGRTLDGKRVQTPKQEDAVPEQKEDGEKKEEKKPLFTGVGRTIRGKHEEGDKLPEEKPVDPNALYGQPQQKENNSPFSGKARTLSGH